MRYTVHENLESCSGTVSNTTGFLHRYLDTGFKTKWTGYWSPPYKYLDYFSFKINGMWIGENTVEATEYGENMTIYHSTDSLNLVEKISCPEEMPGMRIELEVENNTQAPKAVQIKMEPGVDIRPKDQDLGPEEYDLEELSGRLLIRKKNRKISIRPEDNFDFNKLEDLKEHYPGERQRCYVPGHIIFRKNLEPGQKESIQIDFNVSKASFDSVESQDNSLELEGFSRVFDNSINNLENLIYTNNGKGIIAGHPWFQSYWARDSFWSVLGLIDAGYFETSLEILENFAEKNLDSRIMLDKGSDGKKRSDTGPLFIIAADKLRRHYRISENIEDTMEDAMESIELDSDNIVKHDPEGTWMDTLKRPKAVDIQSLWLEAARIMEDPVHEDLEEGLEQFMSDDYMKDTLTDSSPVTVNPAIPLMFGQLDEQKAQKYLGKLNGELSSRYGARTRSFTDPGYKSSGYHTGSVWGLTTGWAAAANLEYSNDIKGVNFLEKYKQFQDRNQLGALPELVDAENGENLGCLEQAWSAGMMVHCIDSYLLGIRVEEEKVSIDPPKNFSGKRLEKQVGDEKIDLEFQNGEVEILNNPDIEIDIIN